MSLTKPAAKSLAGRRLGAFEVGDPIGRGGFGDVYRAHQPSLGRDAVIKVARAVRDPNAIERFTREARLASQLDHPYAAHIYAFGVEADGLVWIAMELVRGQTLSDYVRSRGAIPLGRFVGFFEALCEVVYTAHQAGLVHRDIKPDNVMVIARAGRLLPKLLDFGIATLNDERATQALSADIDDGWDDPEMDTAQDTATIDDGGRVVRRSGTPAYMAPEQWVALDVDHRADIYALGILAYQCLTGELPFRGDSWHEYMVAHTSQPPPQLGSDFPRALAETLDRALDKDPADRYQTALELGLATRKASDIVKRAGLSGTLLKRWLLLAPKPLADCLAVIDAAKSPDQLAAGLRVFTLSTAQWLAVVALAFRAEVSDVPNRVEGLPALGKRPLDAGEWLALAEEVCEPLTARADRVAIPELVEWFSAEDGTPRSASLSALIALVGGDEETVAGSLELVNHLMRSLDFLCDYTTLHDDDDESVQIGDVEGNPLLELSPLVVHRRPAPGASPALFVVAGPGRTGARMVSHPDGFELDSDTVMPWLDARFAVRAEPIEAQIREHSPYLGLSTFSAEDAERFFGRDRQASSLFNRLIAQPLVTLTGPSGSGKSSLAHAGLARWLGDDWRVVTLRPGHSPMTSLSVAMTKLGVDLESATDLATAVNDDARARQSRVLIVIDQGEELFTLCGDRSERELFASHIASLTRSSSSGVRVLLTIRDDFLGRAEEIPAWRERIAYNVMLLTTPSRIELTEMLEAPARAAGFAFEEGIVADMVEQVADRAGALPLLSFAASRLWEARDRQRQLLTAEAYQELGGVGGALAIYAESVLESLPAGKQRLVRELFRHLVTASGTRAVTPRDELTTIDEHAHLALEHLIAARILVASEGADGVERVAIIHEALLEHWPRLVAWGAEDAAGVQVLGELKSAAAMWSSHQRSDAYLWRGEALLTLRAWRSKWPGRLTAAEQAFVDGSVRAASRGRRRRVALAVVVMAVLAIAVVVLVGLNRAVNSENLRAETRLTELLANRGRSELQFGESARALVYLHAAYERGLDGAGLRVSLAQAAGPVDRELERIAGVSSIFHINHPAHGSPILVTGFADTLRVWRWGAEGAFEFAADIKAEGVRGIAISEDDWLATMSVDTLQTWSVKTGELLSTTPTGEQNPWRLLRISPDNETIVSSKNGGVILYDRHGAKLGELGQLHSDKVPRIGDFSPTARRFALMSESGTLEIYDVASRARLGRLELGEPATLAFVDDERLLAATLGGELVSISPDGQVIERVRAHRGGGLAPALLPDRRDHQTVITSGNDNFVKIWDVKTLEERARFDYGSIASLVLPGAGGKFILTGGLDKSVKVWDRSTGRTILVVEEIAGAAFSPDERSLVTSHDDGLMRRWNLVSSDVVSSFNGHPAAVFDIKFASDEEVATIGSDAIRLWSARTGEESRRLVASNQRTVTGHLFFSEAGDALIASNARNAALWQLESGLRTKQFDLGGDILGISYRNGTIAAIDNLAKDQENAAVHLISILDVASEQLTTERRFDGRLAAIELDGDGDALAYAKMTGEVGLWDLRTGADVWTSEIPVPWQLALSPDGRYLTSGTSGSALKLWNVATGAVVYELPVEGQVLAVAFSPDSALLAAGFASGEIGLWEVASGHRVGTISGLGAPCLNLDFSPSGKLLAAIGRNPRAPESEVVVFRVPREERTPAEIAKLITDKVPYRLDGVELVSVSLDGSAPK